MIEDLYNYLKAEDQDYNQREASLNAADMPSDVVKSAAESGEYAENPNSNNIVVTANSTTEQTTDNPFEKLRVDYKDRPKGGTAQLSTSGKSIWDQNFDATDKLYKDIVGKGVEKATLIFSTIGDRLPTIKKNGKAVPVQISDFGTIMSSNKEYFNAIMDQASSYQDDPKIPFETKWNIIKNDVESTFLSGIFKNFNERMNKELLLAAQMNDGLVKDDFIGIQPFQFAFDKSGKLVDEKTYNTKLQAALKPYYNKVNENERLEKEAKERQYASLNPPAASDMMRVGLPNTTWGSTQVQPRSSSMEVNGKLIHFSRADISMFSQRFTYDYILKNLKAVYDGKDPENITEGGKQASNRAIGTLLSSSTQYNMFASRGGYKTGPVKYLDFNFKNDYYSAGIDENNKHIAAAHDGVKETSSLMWLFDQPGVVYDVGNIKGNIPEKNADIESKLKLGFTFMLDEIDKANELLFDKKRAKYLLPEGVIMFQPIAGGDDEYMAFNVKFNTEYFTNSKNVKKYFGTSKKEDDTEPKGAFDKKEEEDYDATVQPFKGLEKIMSEGFTVYVPTSVAKDRIQLAKYYKGPNDVSAIEGLTLSGGKAEINIPNTGALTFTVVPDPKNPTDSSNKYIQMGGYYVSPSEDGKRFDTIPMETSTFPMSEAINLDKMSLTLFDKHLYSNYIDNMKLLDILKAKYGETNINNLLAPMQKTNTEQYTRPFIKQEFEDEGIWGQNPPAF